MNEEEREDGNGGGEEEEGGGEKTRVREICTYISNELLLFFG